MGKKCLITLTFFLMLASFFCDLKVYAGVNVTLNNYFYVHSNQTGTRQYLKDKYDNIYLQGDAIEHDAVIKELNFVVKGLQSGERLYVIYPDSSTQEIQGNFISLEKEAKFVRVAIDKTTTKETYVSLSTQTTFDDANGGTEVYYSYNMSNPTSYGSLGDGATGGGETGGGDTGETTGIDLLWNNGTRRITWTRYPAETYEIIVTDPDGINYNIVPSTKVFKIETNEGGTYTFKLKKLDGTILLTRTMDVPAATTPDDPDPPDSTDPDDPDDPDSTECTKDGCDWLNDIIFCPGWDVVMGDLTLAIKDALPPPTDWTMVADLIGIATTNHFSGYLGDVPDPPSQAEIDGATYTSIPELDKSVETNDLVPKVPEEYKDGMITFDLNNVPEIEIKDESKPFRIDDPLANVNQNSDPVGKVVLPGDPRNSSNGIKQPDQLNLGNPPRPYIEPNAIPDVTPIPDVSPSEIPIPSDNVGGNATPNITNGPIPIPRGEVIN